jgi:hypothetical protein
MAETVVVTGKLTDSQTIRLDREVVVPKGPVRLTIEAIEIPGKRQTLWEFLDELRKNQAARGHVPRTAEEIRKSIKEDRDTWDY